VFRGAEAVKLGVSRKQISALVTAEVVRRQLPDVYRMSAVAASPEQRLRAALLWAGDEAAAAGRSAAMWYGLEGVRDRKPEIVVPRGRGLRAQGVVVHAATDRDALMIRSHRGLRVTGVEATIARLGDLLDDEALEIACEDARRRRLTSVPALRAYLDRHARRGQRGVGAIRRLLTELDPKHPARSTLEVKTRRLLVAHGITEFVREFPLEWNGRSYWFDFCFERPKVILETNGRRWHDDTADYEDDNEKWSVPGRWGYRIVFATWAKVTRHPGRLIEELTAALAA
jgi:very-short-patch-repair endonuclease